ncbi:Crp/Fnr family transcriptional regulator [Aquimarina algiphila]|uniref:Crp/Fnr family transcriptional regulator n=1 Tax=Aquimarina algiphila TaxID=2047982 RepID=UPI0024920F29|nr:Crp/Fnr family transcriptional regulator [Aquimarina algiphila]
MNELLKQNIKRHINLSEDELKMFNTYFKTKVIHKKNYLLKAGEVCKYEAFVIKGCFRVFSIDKNGNENVLYFAISDWWLSDIDSFTNQIPSQLFIQALEDSEILLINKSNKVKAYQEIPKIERLFRIMTQKFLVSNQRRILQNHSLTSEERYQYFLANYPQIAQKITNIQLASYLGITHEFVSKIRRKIAQKK